jgi:hypothetical protein
MVQQRRMFPMAAVLLLFTFAVGEIEAWVSAAQAPTSSSSLLLLFQIPPPLCKTGWKQRRIHQPQQILDSLLTAVMLGDEQSVSPFEQNDVPPVQPTTLSSIFPPPKSQQQFSNNENNDDESIECNNWVKPSLPSAEIDLVEDFIVTVPDDVMAAYQDLQESTVLRYDVGICGTLMQTGRLSLKIYQALSQSKLGQATMDQKDSTQLRQMTLEFTALQVLQVVLQQSGLQVVSEPDTSTSSGTTTTTTTTTTTSTVSYLAGGIVESIRLVGANEEEEEEDALPTTLESFESLLWSDTWTPGHDFGLVVRNVPVQRIVLSVTELLASIDPNGTLAEQVAAAASSLAGVDAADDNDQDNSTMDSSIMDDDPASLADLVGLNRYRVESAPHAVDSARTVYSGRIHATSYRPIHAQSLTLSPMPDDPTTIRHVMSALVSHGCLLVDVTNGGQDWDQARILHNMWQSVSALYEYVDTAETFGLPGLHTVKDAVGGGAHAKLGFASLQNGTLQCLETRRSRTNGTVLPAQLSTVLGTDGSQALSAAFDMIVQLCQPVVQIVVAASMVEAGAAASMEEANVCASKLVREALDNGQSLSADDIVVDDEGSMSMSPHRLCRYTNINQDDDTDETNDQLLFGKGPSSTATSSNSEVFGAHTDSTFLTAIPVAAVAGLEVFDEAADCWYRPELAAARHYEAMSALEKSEAAGSESCADLPWYARYVILMPGELLQLASRNEVLATVHRVVVHGQSVGGGTNVPLSRLSAPVLLRGRPGVMFDAQRYLSGAGACTLLQECDGQTMQSIDAALMYRSGTSQPN